MIYLDTSVALAQLLAEDRKPPAALWRGPLVASRLLEYELWTRIHALRLTTTHAEAARSLITGLSFLELAPVLLARALEPFPLAVRTLDALHLSSIEFLRKQKLDIRLASYDPRLLEAAAQLGIPAIDL